MEETLVEISKAVSAIGRIDAVPTLLTVLRETTGLRFAAVVRVTEQIWTVCAVQDELQLGIEAGAPLVLETTMPFASRCANAPTIVQQTGTDSPYRVHTGSRLYPLQTYISVPLTIANERYFGNLCAFDSRVMNIPGGIALSMLTQFAAMIASHLQHQLDGEKRADGARASSERIAGAVHCNIRT